MRVRMLRTQAGSPDGIVVEEYRAGESYDLPAHLASAFLEVRAAEEDAVVHRDVVETTAADEPPRRGRGKRARKEG